MRFTMSPLEASETMVLSNSSGIVGRAAKSLVAENARVQTPRCDEGLECDLTSGSQMPTRVDDDNRRVF